MAKERGAKAAMRANRRRLVLLVLQKSVPARSQVYIQPLSSLDRLRLGIEGTTASGKCQEYITLQKLPRKGGDTGVRGGASKSDTVAACVSVRRCQR